MQANPFTQLGLIKPLVRAVAEQDYLEPTRIQREAIPKVLAGDDLLATAQTGTGKTAAFALPVLQLLGSRSNRGNTPIRGGRKTTSGAANRMRAAEIHALVLAPTRELALQVGDSFKTYGRHLPLRTAVVYGGIPLRSQIKALRQKPDILVATPGRLLDLMGQSRVRLDSVGILILDEADRMLDMGFIRDVRRIVAAVPTDRQTLFLSATLPSEIAVLASDLLDDPAYVAVTPAATVGGNIEQKVLFVEQGDKLPLLTSVLKNSGMQRTLVFTRTKHRADLLTRQLANQGFLADSIHSNKNQHERQRALNAFDRGRIEILVATDIVARGIDVEGISHVVNFELPNDPESYVHRIGRTARAGAGGVALSFCDFQEVGMLKEIEKLTRSTLTMVEDHPFHAASIGSLCRGNPASRSSNVRRRLRRRGGRRRTL
ncbi:MAG: DEAD/DEAH box helicase [Candidatus Latescibacterota bacterium]|nr:MAG: DEAD/DEAH box helicase [Candidatus Latescibacterota bacterium]